MYQEYRIEKVVMEVTVGTNTSQINVNNGFSNVYIVTDGRDDAPLSSVQAALAYSTSKTMTIGANTKQDGKQYMNMTHPTAIIQAESQVAATGLAPALMKVSPWLATTYSNVPHYGFKLYNNLIGGSASTIYVGFVFRMFCAARKIA